MKTKIVHKVPNGKLIKVFLEYNKKNNLINSVKITGDFFAYPQDSIDLIEEELKDTVLDKQVLLDKINKIIRMHGIQFIGVDAVSITDCILRGGEL